MNSKEDIELLEKLIGQINGAHKELAILAKKSPNDSLNKFKLELVNQLLSTANNLLGEKYKPFEGFDLFNGDDVPTTSDATMVLSQYMEEIERFRSDNVIYHDYKWWYRIDGKASSFTALAPSDVGKR